MLFKPALAYKSMTGAKTQTRRLERKDDLFEFDAQGEILKAVSSAGRVRFAVGQTSAIQPGRGKPALWEHAATGAITDSPALTACAGLHNVQIMWNNSIKAWLRENGYSEGRLRITQIRRQDVRLISPEDAKAEGFESVWMFLHTWCQINDKAARWDFDPQQVDYIINTSRRRELVDFQAVQQIVLARPAALYNALALTFERVK